MASPTIVRSQGHSGGGTSEPYQDTITLSANPTVGNLLVVVVGFYAYDGSQSVTDNQSNIYTQRALLKTADKIGAAIFTAPVATSTGTHTVTLSNETSSNPFYYSWEVIEISGQAAVFTDVSGTGSGNGTSASASGMADITDASDLIIGGMTVYETGRTITPASGWNQIVERDEANSIQTLNVISRTPETTGAYDPAWTINTSSKWVAAGLAIKGITASTVVPVLMNQYRQRN